MSKMTVTIDGKKIEVPMGTTILEACTAAGSRVPTLCHDQKLHPYGACRICLVEVEGTPRKFTPSCTTPATDNMVVKTTTPALIEARRMVLELLLIKHPLDCPICDKAGECQLQDLVHEYGLGPSRFDAEKGYLPPDYTSAIIERNVSRCVLCGKCVRICDEQNAVGEWAFTRRGTKARISTDFDRPLDCEFCGECVEVCPVGALTTRQFKFKARSWNIETTPSTCNYCGCGCAISYETRNGRIMRVAPGKNNYLCSKGRFGWDAVHSTDRLTSPKRRVNGELIDCSWEEALAVVTDQLTAIKKKKGANHIGGLGSTRTTNEDSYVFQKFLRSIVGTNNLDMLGRLKMPKGLNTAIFSGELAKIGQHDVVLVLDKNVGEYNPVAGIEVVRAVNKFGRTLILVNNEFNKFNRIAAVALELSQTHAITELNAAFGADAQDESAISRAVRILKQAKSVAIVIPSLLTEVKYDGIKELIGRLSHVTLYPIVRRSNLQGALDMGIMPTYLPGYRKTTTVGMSAVEMLDAVKGGRLSALYVMGDDPVGSDPELKKEFSQVEFLVVQDIYLTETAKMAHVVLPAVAVSEKTGTLTNLERRLQLVSPAEVPLGEARPDWEIIQAIAQRMGGKMQYASTADVMREIKATVPLYRDLAVGACWPAASSPLAGTTEDLSLSSDSISTHEVITAERLLFSSGTSITHSHEISTIPHYKVVA